MKTMKKITYWFGTNGVMLTFGCTTRPIAKIPPPFFPSKQWANIFFTFPDEASCEIMDELDFPKPSIPSSASSPDEPRSPDCVAPHLLHKHQNHNMNTNKIRIHMHLHLHVRRQCEWTWERKRDIDPPTTYQSYRRLSTFFLFKYIVIYMKTKWVR